MEDHWNGEILDSIDKALAQARNVLTLAQADCEGALQSTRNERNWTPSPANETRP